MYSIYLQNNRQYPNSCILLWRIHPAPPTSLFESAHCTAQKIHSTSICPFPLLRATSSAKAPPTHRVYTRDSLRVGGVNPSACMCAHTVHLCVSMTSTTIIVPFNKGAFHILRVKMWSAHTTVVLSPLQLSLFNKNSYSLVRAFEHARTLRAACFPLHIAAKVQ